MKNFLFKLYYILSFIYIHTIILIVTIIFRLYYYIRFKLTKTYNNNVKELNLLCSNVSSLQELFETQKRIIPKYWYDPLNGALNWFCDTKLTYCRTIELKEEKHSKDCYEHANALKYIIDNSILSSVYFKTEIVILLSYKPLIKYNHCVTLGYKKTSRGNIVVDIFSPYSYERTLLIDDLKENLYYVIEDYYANKIRYLKDFITIKF